MSLLLNSGKVGNCSSDEEALAAWNESGLLEGLTPSMRKKTAKALENGAKLLLADNDTLYKEVEWRFDTLYFPVIRRCMSGIAENGLDKIESRRLCPLEIAEVKHAILLNNLDVKLIADLLYNNYPHLAKVMESIYGNAAKHMDMEAEVTAQMADFIIDALCKNARYIDTIVTKSGHVIKIDTEDELNRV